MERKIEWESGCYDEIELVYEKAEEKRKIASLLSELEEKALKEAATNCKLLSMDGHTISEDMYQSMSDYDKEIVMYHLAEIGLNSFEPSFEQPIITVKLSPYIQSVLGCTMFSILNRLEKLDGSYNEMSFERATLRMLVPLGGGKGLLKFKVLIMLLYPWLSVQEASSNEISITIP